MPVVVSSRLAMLFVLLGSVVPTAHAETVLITGANSGIGLEFAKQYAADGWHVIASHRRDAVPESLARLAVQFKNVQIETIDVTDAQAVAAAAASLKDVPIDILINNAGIVGTFEDPRQRFGSLDYELGQQFMAVNAAGPLRVSEAFYANVRASKQRKIVAISSMVGSLTAVSSELGRGNLQVSRYWYNMSKAALNMAFVQLAADAARDAISVAAYHPGMVRVARTESYKLPEHLKPMVLDVGESVAALRQQFAALTPAMSGRFYNYDGEALPW